jgi:xanthine dehydrogenase molybdopterin-binding subunit B
MERIAKKLQKDPLEIKLWNMDKIDSPLPNLIKELQQKSDYATRKAALVTFNQVKCVFRDYIKESLVA